MNNCHTHSYLTILNYYASIISYYSKERINTCNLIFGHLDEYIKQ
jgi:hypothetical protein